MKCIISGWLMPWMDICCKLYICISMFFSFLQFSTVHDDNASS